MRYPEEAKPLEEIVEPLRKFYESVFENPQNTPMKSRVAEKQ